MFGVFYDDVAVLLEWDCWKRMTRKIAVPYTDIHVICI